MRGAQSRRARRRRLVAARASGYSMTARARRVSSSLPWVHIATSTYRGSWWCSRQGAPPKLLLAKWGLVSLQQLQRAAVRSARAAGYGTVRTVMWTLGGVIPPAIRYAHVAHFASRSGSTGSNKALWRPVCVWGWVAVRICTTCTTCTLLQKMYYGVWRPRRRYFSNAT